MMKRFVKSTALVLAVAVGTILLWAYIEEYDHPTYLHP
jgi:hypothetical protein